VRTLRWTMSTDGTEKQAPAPPSDAGSRAGRGGWRPGAGRKAEHGARIMRKQLQALTTKRLDGRSAVAIAVRRWKEDVRRDRGGDLTRAQETILEGAAQKLIIRDSLADYIARQSTLISRKRQVLPVVGSFLQVSDSL